MPTLSADARRRHSSHHKERGERQKAASGRPCTSHAMPAHQLAIAHTPFRASTTAPRPRGREHSMVFQVSSRVATLLSPHFRMLEFLLQVDFEPRMVDQVARVRPGVVVDVEHRSEELAQCVRVVCLPVVFLNHYTLERPWLEVADVAKVAYKQRNVRGQLSTNCCAGNNKTPEYIYGRLNVASGTKSRPWKAPCARRKRNKHTVRYKKQYSRNEDSTHHCCRIFLC